MVGLKANHKEAAAEKLFLGGNIFKIGLAARKKEIKMFQVFLDHRNKEEKNYCESNI